MKEIELKFPTFPGEKNMTESEICVACHGCCFYVTTPIDPPRSKDKKDLYSWYLHHKNVEIYIDHDNDWQLMFKTPCNFISENGICQIYEKRPQICRDYQADNCSRVGSDCKVLFATADEMLSYLENKKRKTAKKKGTSVGSKKTTRRLRGK